MVCRCRRAPARTLCGVMIRGAHGGREAHRDRVPAGPRWQTGTITAAIPAGVGPAALRIGH